MRARLGLTVWLAAYGFSASLAFADSRLQALSVPDSSALIGFAFATHGDAEPHLPVSLVWAPAALQSAPALVAAPLVVAPLPWRLTWDNARPTLTSPSGLVAISLRSLIQYDYALYLQAAPGDPAIDFRRAGSSPREGLNATDLQSGTDLRRARLGAEAKLGQGWQVNLTAEFANTPNSITRLLQATLEYRGLEHFLFRSGVYAVPFGLEEGQGAAETVFLERSALTNLVRDLAAGTSRIAANVQYWNENWTGLVAITGARLSDGDRGSPVALLGRAVYRPLSGSQLLVHLGVNATTQRSLNTSPVGPDFVRQGVVRFRDRPELRVDDTRLIDTGDIPARAAATYGVEGALRWKRLTLQAEAARLHVDRLIDARRIAGARDPDFLTYYGQLSWNLWGPARRYSTERAAFIAPRLAGELSAIQGDKGAADITLRYSAANLNSRDILGGRQAVTTLGFTWFPNNVTRFIVQGQWVDISRTSPGANLFGDVTPQPGAQIGQHYATIAMRFQLAL